MLQKLNWKIIGISVGAIFGVLILAIVLFFAFFPTQLAAREAERRIEAATGRDLVLGGDVNVSFWPALGFSAKQASLSNPDGFSTEQPFIAADRIVFAVALLPLLGGDIQVKQLIFEGAELNLVSRTPTEANWTFPTEESAPEQQTTIEDLRLDDVRLIDGVITFQGAGEEPPMVLQDVDASLALESLDAPAQLQANFDYRDQRLTLDSEIATPRAILENGETPLTARLRGDPLEADFDGAFNVATGALTGALEANGSSVRRVMAWIGSPMAEGGGFGAFRLNAQMARLGDRTDLTDATINLDDIEARGTLALIGQESGRLRVEGALNAGAVDLNPYLPTPAQGAQTGGVEVDTAWSSAPLDLSGLRALDANLNLTLGGLRFQRMSFSNVVLALRIANGAADARLSRISLYGGSGTARLIADGSGATPRIAVELNADNVQAEPLLTDAVGFDKIAGRGRLTASLVGAGASQAAVMHSLRGNASFTFNDGAWKGVNLAQMARTVQALQTGETAGQGSATDFAELGANLTVANGIAATENLRLLNPYVRLDGTGVINIGEQTIDMRIAPRAVNSAQGQGGDASIAGLGIPFRVTGAWSRVSFRPAIEEAVQNQLRDVLRQQEEGSPLARLGEALFGRQAATETPTETPASETPASGEAPETPPQAEQPAQPERPTNPLENIFRRAIESQREGEKQEAPEAPAATP